MFGTVVSTFAFGLFHGKRDDERRAVTQLAFGGDVAVVPIRDSTAHRQSDARSFKLIAPVQPLKYRENFVHVPLFKTNAVVPHVELAELFARNYAESPRLNLHYWLGSGWLKLQGVA